MENNENKLVTFIHKWGEQILDYLVYIFFDDESE